MYLEAVEFSSISDVGDMVHVVKVPVVCLPGRQHGHPAELMSHSLLQIGNHTGACESEFKNDTFNNNRQDHRQRSVKVTDTDETASPTTNWHLNVVGLCVLIPCELVKMTSLAFREVGDGLLNDRRWKLTVWSHTAPGKPTLHSALWEQ